MEYKKDFDKFQEDYTKKYPAANFMRDIFLEMTKSERENKSLLDIGCGSGIDLGFLKNKGYILFGIDISPELVTIAKNKVPEASILEGSFTTLPYEESYFDFVWSKYALQHEREIYKPLSEIYRVLKKRGKAFVQVTHPMRSAEYLDSKNYFQKQVLIDHPMVDGSILTEYHHTISDYIQTIIQIGFSLVYISEILNRPENEYNGPISPSALILVIQK